MPRYLQGWLDDVVRYSLKRQPVNLARTRRVYSLRGSILSVRDKDKPSIIAEFKRSSPSGFRAPDIDPVSYAVLVQNYGACGISVLTEEKFFSGSYDDLRAISRAVSLPVLMKDFVVKESQVDSAFSLGADAILLIVRILTERELEGLIDHVRSYGMEPLVEVHDTADLNIALNAGADLIGINSRDLSSLNVDTKTIEDILANLADEKKKGILLVAESGIKDRETLMRLRERGADAFLIGTAIMESPERLKELLGES